MLLFQKRCATQFINVFIVLLCTAGVNLADAAYVNLTWTWNAGPSTSAVAASYGTRLVNSPSNEIGYLCCTTGKRDCAFVALCLLVDHDLRANFRRRGPSNVRRRRWHRVLRRAHHAGAASVRWVDPGCGLPQCAVDETAGSGGKLVVAVLPCGELMHAVVSRSQDAWTWVRGNVAASYGTKGVEDDSNEPATRSDFAHCMTPTGDLFVFGGQQSSSDGTADMMKFSTSSKRWTWFGTQLSSLLPAESALGFRSLV